MRFEIEAEIPETHEPTGEYRQAKTGEPWIDGRGLCDIPTNYCVIILREKWKWPAWLKADFAEWSGQKWLAHGENNSMWLTSDLFDFTPPPGNHKIGDRVFNPNRRES
jgi:hypothetical protein